MIHELGHTQGLAHATVNPNIMVSGYTIITISLRTLGDGDKAGAVHQHPASSFSGTLPHSIVLPNYSSGGYNQYSFTAVTVPSSKTLQLESGVTINGNITIKSSATVIGAGQTSSTISGQVSFPGSVSNAKLKNLKVTSKITVGGSSNLVEDVTCSDFIYMPESYLSTCNRVTVTGFATWDIVLSAGSSRVFNFTSTRSRNNCLYGHMNGSYPEFAALKPLQERQEVARVPAT